MAVFEIEPLLHHYPPRHASGGPMSDDPIPQPRLAGRPLPVERAELPFVARFSGQDAERVKQGLWPEVMEDKWAIIYEEPWLFFHRSWTGKCIYVVRLQEQEEALVVVEAWVNQCPEEYRGESPEYETAMLRFLIEGFLLKKDVPFPSRSGPTRATPALLQQVHVGRVFRSGEKPVDPPQAPSYWERMQTFWRRKI